MKRQAPAAARNREPIADILAEELPVLGTVLEVASGTGEHVLHFAARFPQLQWQPSDPDGDARSSIAAWSAEAGLANIAAPLEINAAMDDWPVGALDAIICINMIHISQIEATYGLLAAAKNLPQGAPLILYGPYLEEGVETAASNLAFDQSLKSRNDGWGLRQAEWLDEQAAVHGLSRSRRVAMPANNIMLIYRKTA